MSLNNSWVICNLNVFISFVRSAWHLFIGALGWEATLKGIIKWKWAAEAGVWPPSPPPPTLPPAFYFSPLSYLILILCNTEALLCAGLVCARWPGNSCVAMVTRTTLSRSPCDFTKDWLTEMGGGRRGVGMWGGEIVAKEKWRLGSGCV